MKRQPKELVIRVHRPETPKPEHLQRLAHLQNDLLNTTKPHHQAEPRKSA